VEVVPQEHVKTQRLRMIWTHIVEKVYYYQSSTGVQDNLLLDW